MVCVSLRCCLLLLFCVGLASASGQRAITRLSIIKLPPSPPVPELVKDADMLDLAALHLWAKSLNAQVARQINMATPDGRVTELFIVSFE